MTLQLLKSPQSADYYNFMVKTQKAAAAGSYSLSGMLFPLFKQSFIMNLTFLSQLITA
jgi:hypothetical protein